MQLWQQIFLLVFAFFNFLIFFKGFYQSKYRKNAFTCTYGLFFLGIFVWGDAVIFGLFWSISSLIAFIFQDWYLFLLITSVFWIVRSLGETIYWLNQQFSSLNRNPVKNLLGHSIFYNDSIWFIYQIFWQSINVISIIPSIYLANLWLKNLNLLNI